MNSALSVRDEIFEIIGNMPERKLHALRDFLADDDDMLSDEEVKLLEQCRKDIKEYPENFTPWEQVRRES